MTKIASSLGLKLTLILSILATIGFTSLVVYVPWLLTARRNIKDVIRQINNASVQSTTQEVDRIFNNVTTAQQLIANSSNRKVIDLNDEQSRSQFFLSLLEANPNFTWVQYGYSNGNFIGAQRDIDGSIRYHNRQWDARRQTAKRRIDTYKKVNNSPNNLLKLTKTKTFEQPFNAIDRPWYINALQMRGQNAWSVYVYASNNLPGIDSSISLEKNGKVQGVIGIGVELKWISLYLSKTQKERSQKGSVFIVNSKHELIASSDPMDLLASQQLAKSSQKLPQMKNIQNIHLSYVSQLISEQNMEFGKIKQSQDHIYQDPSTGEKYYISFAPLNQLDWVVGTVVPASVYYAPIDRNNAILGVILLVLITLTSITIVYIADKSLARPITKLTEAASKIAAGDFDVEVEVRGKNEIGKLAHVFNKMTRKLKHSQMDLADFNRTLERKVEERTGELKAVLGNMIDGLAVVSPQNLVIQYNNSLLKMLVLSPEEVNGQFTQDVFAGDMPTLINQSRIDQKEVFNTEVVIHNGKGIGKATISSICIADRNQEICLGSLVLIRDITFEKEVDRMKTDFVSSVSHELRTPLTSVLGFAKLIQKKLEETIFPIVPRDDKKVQRAARQIGENINIIVSEGNRLTKLINDVLDIAKMEAGKVDWNMQPIQVQEVIHQALAATSALFETKGLQLIRDIPEDIPPTIGDQNRLIQVVINLISNAVKFQDQGAITCQCRVENKNIFVRVIDQGSGIAQEDIPKVFEKFKQVGDTLTSKPQGTGLGLPICKEIVEHHKGILWAESTIGKGSTFYFTLPIVAISEPVVV